MENKDELFELKINEQGRSVFHRVFRLTKACFWTTLIVEIFILFYSLRNYFRYRNFEMPDGEINTYYWDLRIYTGYAIIFSLLVILQGYLFLQFTREAKRSMELNDSYTFNNSFNWIRKSLIISLVLIIINAIYFLLLYVRES